MARPAQSKPVAARRTKRIKGSAPPRKREVSATSTARTLRPADANRAPIEEKEGSSRMAPPSAADENPSEPDGDSPDRESPGLEPDGDSRWLQTLSEPELDLVISLKELAVTQAAAHPDLSHRFHLRTLRALGIVLLEVFKDRLEQTSGGMDGLAMLRDPDVPEVQVQSISNGVDRKRRQLQHGSGEEGASSSKKRKMVIR